MSARKEASRQLGIALQAKYRKLVEASGEDEIQIAAVDLGNLFNINIEQIIWFLRTYGGDKLRPLEKNRKAKTAPLGERPDGNTAELPVLPQFFAVNTTCQCPPLEPGIIGDKHMVSCPQYGS